MRSVELPGEIGHGVTRVTAQICSRYEANTTSSMLHLRNSEADMSDWEFIYHFVMPVVGVVLSLVGFAWLVWLIAQTCYPCW